MKETAGSLLAKMMSGDKTITMEQVILLPILFVENFVNAKRNEMQI